jgi:hypothetical protein
MPGEDCGFCEDITGTGDDVANLQQGIASAYLWGRIEYKDVFKRKRWTIFQFESDVRRGNEWKVKYSDDGNDPD